MLQIDALVDLDMRLLFLSAAESISLYGLACDRWRIHKLELNLDSPEFCASFDCTHMMSFMVEFKPVPSWARRIRLVESCSKPELCCSLGGITENGCKKITRKGVHEK